MFQNYLKLAIRNLKRYKGYSVINIAGITAGIACCAIIILLVQNELTYDSYHPDADRIYRIAAHRISNIGEHSLLRTPGDLVPKLKENYPQVETAVRLTPPFENKDNVLVQRDDIKFYETKVWFADPEIFDRQYRYEEQTSRLLAIITAIGLIVASLGLVGLASFTTISKKKEIGIRKVLGATVTNVVILLSREFTKWVVITNIIAWPVAWFLINK